MDDPILAHVAFLSVALASVGRDELEPSQLALMTRQLHAWKPLTTKRRLEAVIADARAAYQGSKRVDEVAEALGAQLSEDQRRHVIGNLSQLARVEGGPSAAARAFIAEVDDHFEAEPTMFVAPVFADDDEGTAIVAPVFGTGPPSTMDELDEPTQFMPPVFAQPQEPEQPESSAPAAEFGFSDDMIGARLEHSRCAFEVMTERAEPLAALIEGPLARWRDSASVLGLERGGHVREGLLASLVEPGRGASARLHTASLLFTLDPKEGPELLLELADEAEDADLVDAVVGAFELCGVGNQARLLLRGYSQARADQRRRWLLALERQAIDPGSEVLAAALASTHPEELAAGLGLLCVHEDRDEHRYAILPHLFAREPRVRRAAIIAALILDLPQAPIVLGHTARHPGMSVCAYLHALDASAEALDELSALLRRDDAPEGLGSALALSGRPRAIAAVADDSTLPALRFVTGYDGEVEGFTEWWRTHADNFEPNTRYVLGIPATPKQLIASLPMATAAIWPVLRLELLVRSRGRVALPSRALPHVMLAAIEAIHADQLGSSITCDRPAWP